MSALSLEALAELVARLRRDGKRVVHARGVYDLLQRADIGELERARSAGQALVVTVHEADGIPAVLDAKTRADVVAALPFVTAVAVETGSADACIKTIGADIVASAVPAPESARFPAAPPSQVHVLDAVDRKEVVYAKRPSFEPDTEEFLQSFRERFTATDVLRSLESLKKLRVLVVGDAIIDEYHFVRPYGMPLKAPIIAAQFLDGEAYAGGILAVANHIAGFCGEVHLVTALGAKDSREEFIRKSLRANVDPKFFIRDDGPTTIKRRYLRKFLLQKLFEVGFFNDRPLPQEVDAQLVEHLEKVAGDYDCVVVADFGHGTLSHAAIEALGRKSKFLAINTQLNSVNFGYHVVTKYGRADYVCIDEEEMRMACRERFAPLQDLVPQIARGLNAKAITVTRGHHGSVTWQPGTPPVRIPIFSRQVIDTIGAGDAYLSVTAPCVCMGLPPDLVGFIGNAVGALAVRIIGNQSPVEPEELFDFIKVLMG